MRQKIVVFVIKVLLATVATIAIFSFALFINGGVYDDSFVHTYLAMLTFMFAMDTLDRIG